MAKQSSTFAFSALAAALVVPLATAIWFFSGYDFTKPDGTPDNALIRSFPAVALFGLVCVAAALSVFSLLGRIQLARPRPSFRLILWFSSILAVPLPAFVYYNLASSNEPMPLWAVAMLYAFAWLSLCFGSLAQYLRIQQRPNNSFKPTPLRGAA